MFFSLSEFSISSFFVFVFVGLAFSTIFRDGNDDAEENDRRNDPVQHNEPINRDPTLIDPPQPISRMNLNIRNLNSLQADHRPSLTNGNGGTSARGGNHSTIDLESESELSASHQSRHIGSTSGAGGTAGNRKLPTHNKFHSFGQFVASSLIDMPETKALELVQRITGEIVQTLIAAKSPKI